MLCSNYYTPSRGVLSTSWRDAGAKKKHITFSAETVGTAAGSSRAARNKSMAHSK